MLGLPGHVTACLFDLDGVLTQTARVHNAAWKQTFDEFLRQRAAASGEPFQPFDPGPDYNRYVDGRPRADGVRSFLASRGIVLPEGAPDDPPDADTVNGVGNRKNVLLLRHLRDDGVEVYPGSVRYLQAAATVGLRRAVVTASANGGEVVVAAGLEPLLEARVDGLVAQAQGLRGKPHPDTFIAGASLLGVDPTQAAVFEDALSGVAAGRAGGFGYVVGVDRVGQADELLAHGADIVVKDLSELLDTADLSMPIANTAAHHSATERGPA
ncbi:HAD family hydrolase [Micromonospora parathelypteridis]|uniref:Beta-phosphoglucomutase family hydrolase n=1 Tax=Micromonospora parathelypteridis TaxID=1839617 RepID=A0A840W1S9_9ACTN|nr:HAD-IA family hydrolase [Micromonospora parathelypteridis]MBB5478780.1 beta-phosphoglucomutase family hydrolase [Micromonospora parathelypteridis]GGO04575.1 hydrolase [Micromonospora parathelypteridis]